MARMGAVWLLLVLTVTVGTGAGQLQVTDSSSDTGSDNKLLCMAEMVSSIENSCSQSDIQGLYVALEALLKQYLSKCFHTNFTQNRALHEIMPDINDNVTAWLRDEADSFKVLVGLEDIVPTFVPPQQVNAEVELMMHSNLANSYDGWLLDPYVYGLVSKYGAFYPLDDFVRDPALGLMWDDVLPFVRNVHATFRGQTVAMPLDVRVDLLFYRKDLLQNVLNVTAPPASWPELLQMARQLNGTDMNGDGVPDYGICIDVRADCGEQVNNLMAIAASMLQYAGTAQGLFFDPTTIQTGLPSAVLVDNPAFQAALATYVNLTAYAPPLSPIATCLDHSYMVNLFSQGSCAFIMGSRIFKNIVTGGPFNITGKLGVTQLPGSAFVLNRTSKGVVPCTPTLCPYATPDANGTLINRTPWSSQGGWVLAVNRRSTSNYLNVTVAFHAYLTTPAKSWQYITDPVYEFEPYRTSHLTDVQRWADMGYNANDTKQWLNALALAMDMSSTRGVPGLGYNMAMDLRVPVTKYVRDLYTFAITNATLNVPLSNITSTLAAAVSKLLLDSQQVQASLSDIVDAYYATIGYQEPPPPPLPPAPPSLVPPPSPLPKAGSPSWLPIAIILPVIGALLLVATAVMYEVRNKRKHKDLFGNVQPPRVAPDTSILIMEIQDIEAISAAVSGEVLSASLEEYAAVVRHALLRHSGYEASYDPTTGAFALAFHSPKDALLAGLDVQTALLGAAWPADLIALPQCAPVHVLALSGEGQESALNDILDANETVMYTSHTTARSKLQWFTQGLTRRKDAATPGSENDVTDFRIMGNLGAPPAGPTIPALVHVPTSQTYSFATACQHAWKEAGAGDTAKVLIFKGLRVRMGIHAGVTNAECIVVSKEDKNKKVQYLGQPVQLATAIAHTAHGGMILLSEDTYKKLPLERLWDRYLVIHVGEHSGLEACAGTTNLYHALNRTLEGRLAQLSQLDSPTQLDTGVLDAPVGCVTVAFMNVVGAQTLLSWNADIAQSALKLFHSVVGEELKRRHGYLVEAVDGLFLAAFLKPLNAIVWSLECNDLMLKQSWPDELLMHELCEELVISSPTRDGDMLNSVVFRGPRLKTGVDTGQVLGEVHAMTGRMTYRGKVMNRAARIASTASTGQVLCSADSWDIITNKDPAALAASKVQSSSLGQFRLKGVAERIEIYHCRKAASAQRPNRRGNSMVVNITEGHRWNWEGQGPNAAKGPRADEAVDAALPARLDKEGPGEEESKVDPVRSSLVAAAAGLGRFIPSVRLGTGEVSETQEPEDDDDDDDDEVDDDDDNLGGDPYVLAGPPVAPAPEQYTIPAARDSRPSRPPAPQVPRIHR